MKNNFPTKTNRVAKANISPASQLSAVPDDGSAVDEKPSILHNLHSESKQSFLAFLK